MKATHYGTCQVCHARQKLPGGRLSIHGYSVALGFFSGTCFGTRELPLEVSCDMVQKSIVRAEAKLGHIRAQISELAKIDGSGTHAWVHTHRYTGRVIEYRWEELEHSPTDIPGIYTRPYPARGHAQVVGNLQDIILRGRDSYLRHLSAEAVNIARYIDRQQSAIDNWEPQALQPIKGQAT